MPYTKKYRDTLYNREWLYQKYAVEDRNAAQVAALIGCNLSAVLGRLRKFGIPTKDGSEAQKLAKFDRGSSAPRPRGKFLRTTQNPEWLRDKYTDKGLSLVAIGKLAGCSAASVSQALDKFGIERQSRSLARKTHKKGNEMVSPSAFGSRKDPSEMTEAHWRRLSRSLVPPGPCAVCGKDGTDVNHKDRDFRNNGLGNLEMLCKRCHVQQHSDEAMVAFKQLKELGVPFMTTYEEARVNLLKKLKGSSDPDPEA